MKWNGGGRIDLIHYDVVYMSKVFSNAYSPDVPEPMNCDKVVKGGTGYAIHLENGKEVFAGLPFFLLFYMFTAIIKNTKLCSK